MTPTWRILAELTYEADDDELLFGRLVAVSGVGEVIRPLDGYGRTIVEPGEGVLLGLTPGVPLWWIDGDRVSRAFRERGSIIVSDADRLSDSCETNSPHRGTRRLTR